MAPSTLGDGVQAMLLRQANVQLRDRLNTLANELSSGKKSDLTAELGDTSLYRDAVRQMETADAQTKNAAEVGQGLAAMQTYLEQLDGERRGLIDSVVTISNESTEPQVIAAADQGRQSFDAMVATLNGRFAGRSLFAGNATDTTPLADAEVILTDLRTAIAGAADADAAIAAIDAWFDTPGGGFDTVADLSTATGPQERRIDETTTITIEAEANDATLREALKSVAIVALADDTGIAMPTRERAQMVRDATDRLFNDAQNLAGLRGRIGLAEARVETVEARLTAQVTSLTILRNNLDAADPFETATILQEVQGQMEMHYTITARLARMSLAEYI